MAELTADYVARTPTHEEFAGLLLSLLEEREERLLSWGFYDISTIPSEVEVAIEDEATETLREAWRQLRGGGATMAGIMQRMEAAGLLHLAEPQTPAYRTRFGEGVRLMARLRQRFQPKDWAIAPRLVADIKMRLTPRRYPRRDLRPAEIWADIASICSTPLLQQEVFDALAGAVADREPIGFSGFQRRAIHHILSRYGGRGLSGSVISAGTGAGKTKAFYIPALVGISAELSREPFTKVIAIYPRNVLLADQLREALSEAGKLRDVLARHRLRAITFGALLGETPSAYWFEQRRENKFIAERRGWLRVGDGFVVPFLKSPAHRDADLVWRDADRRAGRTCLYRVGAQDPDVPDGELILTRDALMANPPDVLFLSAEMLNRELGNPQWSRTFGIDAESPKPRLLLLDEVHAYEGLSGAQVAWLLRRWRYWAGVDDLHVTSLSATLKNATFHLAAISGVAASAVVEFRPDEREMLDEGMEYNLAVKGDSSSGAQLLSTSIQVGMLLARLLTPRAAPPSPPNRLIRPEAFYARKVFGFSDNLDGVNRWFSDMVSAESSRLAALRRPPQSYPPGMPRPTPAQEQRMRDGGQIWDLPSQLGHRLEVPLVVTRCTSQSPRAAAGADLVIATSKLEVGFDDPGVGAILHYKRPRTMASFIQRKGRAGRARGTRPWTVVVLSDYGQDRWAFQNADKLFQPEIDHVRLPVHNPYVLRTQATYFLVEWLARRMGGDAGPFDQLARPGFDGAQSRAIAMLRDFLDCGPRWAEFRKDFSAMFARHAFPGLGASAHEPPEGMGEADLDAILWDPPRPLLRHVIPTLLRKLETHWERADPASPGIEDAGVYRPVPQYLPSATFADLDLAEVRVGFEQVMRPKDEEWLAISLGLFEGCPGRVSKRFSVAANESGYWNPLSTRLTGGGVAAGAREAFPDSMLLQAVGPVQVYQPIGLTLVPRPSGVKDSSNGQWNWQTSISAGGTGRRLPVLGGAWSGAFLDCSSFLHRNRHQVEVLRFARDLDYEIRRDRADPLRGRMVLQSPADANAPAAESVPEAIGFRLVADGIRARLDPGHLAAIPFDLPADLLARFRGEYYLHLLRTDTALSEVLNHFMAEWVWQISMAMLGATAVHNRCTLVEAQRRLASARSAAARRVLDRMFGIQGVDEHGQDIEGRRRQEVQAIWDSPDIVAHIARLERCLWEAPGPDFHEWVRRRYVATLAQALRVAAVAQSSDLSEEDLAVDVIWHEREAAIFLTEQSSGGLGQIETVVRRIFSHPESFHDGLEHALNYCPRAESAGHLLAVADRASSGRPRRRQPASLFADVLAQVRAARGYQPIGTARDALRDHFRATGLSCTRSAVVSVVSTMLAPGSTPDTDRLIHLLNRAWGRASCQLGVEIDARAFAYMVTHGRLWERALRQVFAAIGGLDPDETQLYALVQRLLLSGCRDACRDCLDQPNRYNDFGTPSRALALRWVNLATEEVAIDDPGRDWRQQAAHNLRRTARVCLTASDAALLGAVLPGLLVEELEVDYLLLPLSVSRVENRKGRWAVTVRLRQFDETTVRATANSEVLHEQP